MKKQTRYRTLVVNNCNKPNKNNNISLMHYHCIASSRDGLYGLVYHPFLGAPLCIASGIRPASPSTGSCAFSRNFAHATPKFPIPLVYGLHSRNCRVHFICVTKIGSVRRGLMHVYSELYTYMFDVQINFMP